MEFTYRMAELCDARDILSIYSHYVLNTPYTFDHWPPPLGEYILRMEKSMVEFPFIVALSGSRTVGYAYAHRISRRLSARRTAELTVYVHPDFLGVGLGRGLYRRLITLLAAQGIKKVCALVGRRNPSSIAFHESVGFIRSGEVPDTDETPGGGIWLCMPLLPDEADGCCPPLLRTRDLARGFVDGVLN